MVVVSVHDVAPSQAAGVAWLLERLDSIGARPRVLKVIPMEGGVRPVASDPALLDLLRREAAGGSEVVLHGYTHLAAGELRGSWPMVARGHLFAGAAAEFLSVDDISTAERIRTGREELRRLGFDPTGFCAPGWLARPSLTEQLADLGFSHELRMASLVEPASGRRLWMPWIGYMGVGSVLERLVGWGGLAGLVGARAFPVLKVFLHPQDAARTAGCEEVLTILREVLKRRLPVTYAQLVS